jgi:hypothetical protein
MNRDEAEIRAIDARIAAAMVKQRDFGTVITRDTTGPGATVLFDNATTPQPVKVLGHVNCFPDDRVVVELFKTTWVVVGSFVRRGLGETTASSSGPAGAANTSSATFVDMPSNTTALFTKRYSDTLVRFRLWATTWTSIANTEMQSAVRIQGTPGTATEVTFTAVDVAVGYIEYDSVGVRASVHGQARSTTIPAGDFTLTARWRRAAGTGACIMDSHDLIILEADELHRTNT